MSQAGVWVIATLTIFAILIRPRDWNEALWACTGAVLLVVFRYVSPHQALVALERGTDVYLFLAGMMLLAELARRQGLFDWLASHAVAAAKGSRVRLFALVYGVGVGVTTLLSNDATAVVLTPAVYAAVKKARSATLPYLFICAFIANAASFVLPISNPANLVIFGKNMPPLSDWVRFFALPSVLAIATTYILLRFLVRRELEGEMEVDVQYPALSSSGSLVAWGIVATGVALLIASAAGKDLGLPTFVAAAMVLVLILLTGRDKLLAVLRHIPWGTLPLVAGLFIIVEGLNTAGSIRNVRSLLQSVEHWPPITAGWVAAFGAAALSNVGNNLPVGLLAGSAMQGHNIPALLRNAVVIGVDLGPNLSVTGSLATILWLTALRREGEHVSAWTFLKYGIVVMPFALLVATCGLLFTE